jgi:hypothetical protein
MNRTKIDTYNQLVCPTCGSTYLHQKTVGVYNCEEDKSEGTHVEVDWNRVTVDNSMSGNPSPRRHGLSILFYCEECDGENPASQILNIYQHKGQTFMEWEGK